MMNTPAPIASYDPSFNKLERLVRPAAPFVEGIAVRFNEVIVFFQAVDESLPADWTISTQVWITVFDDHMTEFSYGRWFAKEGTWIEICAKQALKFMEAVQVKVQPEKASQEEAS